MGESFAVRKTRAGVVVQTRQDEGLGFHGAAPTVQRASANQAVATDAASALVLVNELRAALVEKGIIKGSA